MMKAIFKTITAFLLGLGMTFIWSPAFSQEIEWDSVPANDISLFYPGQASWEWVLTASNHTGATKFRQGRNCSECHEGEESAMGDLIVSGQKLEPKPIAGKRGSIPVKVKMAYDDANFYIRMEWTEQGLDGFPVIDEKYEAKATIMFDDGSVVEATRAGCWGACHDDVIGMPSASGLDLTKYLSRTRTKNTRTGGGDSYKPAGEIEALAAEGGYLEYWQAKLNHDQPAVAVSGHILATREEAPCATVKATAKYDHGNWVVTLSRPLKAGGDYHKNIVPGKTYTFGLAIHEGHSGQRYHHVSFDHTFALDGGEADIIATKQ